MRQYDSIPTINQVKDLASQQGTWLVQDKADGSNIRVEVNPKKGEFTKWGSRKVLLDPTNEGNLLSKAVKVFGDTFDQDALLGFLRGYSKNATFTLFFEFHGPSSFAGSHDAHDTHILTLLDIWEEKKGYIPAADLPESLHPPKLITEIPALTDAFISKVQSGTLEGMGSEGVILKRPKVRMDGKGQTRAVKVKRLDWIQKVQATYHNWKELI